MTDPKSGFQPQIDTWDSNGEDETNDLFYTKGLLKHLRNTYCLNMRRIYAVGLGTGGGMIHQMACQTQLSREIAAFAAVAPAIFKGKDREDRFWGSCPIGRRPVPILGVSGLEDKVYPADESRHVETEDTLPASVWTRNWAGYNGCGEPRGLDSFVSENSTAILTDFDKGQMAEGVAFAGHVNKISYRCGMFRTRKNKDLWKKDPDVRSTSVLHYIVSNAGHGWVRASFEKGPATIELKGHMLRSKGSQHFDSSAVVLGFFNGHRLPNAETVSQQAREMLIERGAKNYDYTDEANKGRLFQEQEKAEKLLKQKQRLEQKQKKEL
jgi:poly(3-hydroxybutyrate) depolymerase